MISGIFENCIGTRDLEGSLKYWAEFGYREVHRGQFNAEQTKLLYGHASNLQSIRLQNGNSSAHGLLRIMCWEHPRNQGLKDTLPMVVGSRWFASLVKDVYAIADAFVDENANGGKWIYTEPVRSIEVIGKWQKVGIPKYSNPPNFDVGRWTRILLFFFYGNRGDRRSISGLHTTLSYCGQTRVLSTWFFRY